MSTEQLMERGITEYLGRHQQKELLRFVAVGSVDDGKSTLIGRLLHDTHGVYEDQLSAVKRASKQAEGIDFSLFTDGLKAEREQGITIDVAYRYFATDRRKFIIADTPGHVQYTRNMATGASTADLAIILIDARLGVLQQSRRHAYIASLLGIGQLVVCVNKMDLVDFAAAVFERIRADFAAFASKLGFDGVTFVPVSALAGDNVVHRSERTPWYDGPTLLEHLEAVPPRRAQQSGPFRYPVQTVLRPNLDYRAFAGQIVGGTIEPGQEILVLPSGRKSRVVGIDTFEGELPRAFAPMSVALRLADEVDVSRGDMLVRPGEEPRVATRIDAMLVWMSERPLDTGRSYFVKHCARYVRVELERIAHAIDLETLEPVAASQLELNDIGRVTFSAHRPLFFDPYSESRATGSFVVIDALTNNTVAAGMILGAASEEAASSKVEPNARPRSLVSAWERRERLQQRGAAIVLTGPARAGKSSIAYALERLLFDRYRFAVVIDPEAGEVTSELARTLVDSGLLAVLTVEALATSRRDEICRAVGDERCLAIGVGPCAPSELEHRVALEDEDATAAAEQIYALLGRRGLL